MPRMRPNHRNRLYFALAAVLASGGCVNPNSLALLQGQLNEAADAVNDLRMSISRLQTSIDSMNIVIAKQDTTIGRLATAAGIPVEK